MEKSVQSEKNEKGKLKEEVESDKELVC